MEFDAQSLRDLLGCLRNARKHRRWPSTRTNGLLENSGALAVVAKQCQDPAALARLLFRLTWSDRQDEEQTDTHLIHGLWILTLKYGLGSYQPLDNPGIQSLIGLGRNECNLRERRALRSLRERLNSWLADQTEEPDRARALAAACALPNCLIRAPQNLQSLIQGPRSLEDWAAVAPIAAALLVPGQDDLKAAIERVVERLMLVYDAPWGGLPGGWNDAERWAIAALWSLIGRSLDDILKYHRGVPLPAHSGQLQSGMILIAGDFAPGGRSPFTLIHRFHDVEDLEAQIEFVLPNIQHRNARQAAEKALDVMRSAIVVVGVDATDQRALRIAREAGMIALRNLAGLEDVRAYSVHEALKRLGADDSIELNAEAVSHIVYVDTAHGFFGPGRHRLGAASGAFAVLDGHDERSELMIFQLNLLKSGFVLREVRGMSLEETRSRLTSARQFVQAERDHVGDHLAIPDVLRVGSFRRVQELRFEEVSGWFRTEQDERHLHARDVCDEILQDLESVPPEAVRNLPASWRCQWNLFSCQVALVIGDRVKFIESYTSAVDDFLGGQVRDLEDEPPLERFSHGQAGQRLLLCAVLAQPLFDLSLEDLRLTEQNLDGAWRDALTPLMTAPLKRRRAANFLWDALGGGREFRTHDEIRDVFFALR